MTPIILAGPAVEPIGLAAMKSYLRIDGSDEDELVSALISAGRIAVERATRLTLIAQAMRLVMHAWPPDGIVRLPVWPILSLDAVRVSMVDGSFVALAPGAYSLDAGADPARLRLGASVPVPAGAAPGIQIDLTAGFGADATAVPQPLVLAVRRLAAAWFESRGDEPQAPDRTLPAGVPALLAPFRRRRLA